MRLGGNGKDALEWCEVPLLTRGVLMGLERYSWIPCFQGMTGEGGMTGGGGRAEAGLQHSIFLNSASVGLGPRLRGG